MRSLFVALALLGLAAAEDCKVTGMDTQSGITPGVATTHDYGHGVKVTTGGPSDYSYRVYTVQTATRIYKLKANHWYLRLDLGPAACRLKGDNLLVLPPTEKKELKFPIIGEQSL
jgi:hypothetical protein